MSAAAISMPAKAEADVARAILLRLRGDAAVQSVFGTPARIFDEETDVPAYPNAVLERHQTSDAGSSCVPALEHRITISVASRWGGRRYAKEAIGFLRQALETSPLAIDGQTVVLQQVVFTDVLRTSDARLFRGVLQFRVVTEEAV